MRTFTRRHEPAAPRGVGVVQRNFRAKLLGIVRREVLEGHAVRVVVAAVVHNGQARTVRLDKPGGASLGVQTDRDWILVVSVLVEHVAVH